MNLKTKIFKSKKSLAFYIALMAWPVLQFLVFYVYVNFNSILLAFKEYYYQDRMLNYVWTGKNFSQWFTDTESFLALKNALWVSLKSYLILLVTVPLGLFFSYYIFKKLPGAMLFRFLLFLPQIISSIVLVTVYCLFVENGMIDILKMVGINADGLISKVETRYGMLMFYNVFIGFGTSVLLYANKMSTVSPELTEACRLDGANTIREFWHVILPHTFPTLSVFLVSGLAGIFINQINNFPFFQYQMHSDTTTIGFYLFNVARRSAEAQDLTAFPSLSALGLILTAIIVPVTFTAKYLLEKFGPSEE